MASFAKIENGLVTEVIVADSAFVNRYKAGVWVDLTNEPLIVGIGYGYDGLSFSLPEPVTPPLDSGAVLDITLSATKVRPNEPITANIAVTQGGIAAPITDTYYVPVIRDSDGYQAEFLEVSIVDGSGSISFSITGRGKYTIDMNKITPTPTSRLSSNPEFIVA